LHTYRETKHDGESKAIWTVGFETDQGGFRSLADFHTQREAAAWTSYLNGGRHPRITWNELGE
jgi:hypothetical protein